MEGGDEFIEVKVTSPHKVGLTKNICKDHFKVKVYFINFAHAGRGGDVLVHGLHCHHLDQPLLLQKEEPGSQSEILRLPGPAGQAGGEIFAKRKDYSSSARQVLQLPSVSMWFNFFLRSVIGMTKVKMSKEDEDATQSGRNCLTDV